MAVRCWTPAQPQASLHICRQEEMLVHQGFKAEALLLSPAQDPGLVGLLEGAL